MSIINSYDESEEIVKAELYTVGQKKITWNSNCGV